MDLISPMRGQSLYLLSSLSYVHSHTFSLIGQSFGMKLNDLSLTILNLLYFYLVLDHCHVVC